jgi:hypothetical protein
VKNVKTDTVVHPDNPVKKGKKAFKIEFMIWFQIVQDYFHQELKYNKVPKDFPKKGKAIFHSEYSKMSVITIGKYL